MHVVPQDAWGRSGEWSETSKINLGGVRGALKGPGRAPGGLQGLSGGIWRSKKAREPGEEDNKEEKNKRERQERKEMETREANNKKLKKTYRKQKI